jgi:hypothetical protein
MHHGVQETSFGSLDALGNRVGCIEMIVPKQEEGKDRRLTRRLKPPSPERLRNDSAHFGFWLRRIPSLRPETGWLSGSE